ncbi:unnamed protein product, partial [Bubo scandiacus]
MAGCGLSEDACFSSFFYNYTSSWETSYNQVRGGRCREARSPSLRPPGSSGEAKVVPVWSFHPFPGSFGNMLDGNSYGSRIGPCRTSLNPFFEKTNLLFFFYLISPPPPPPHR